MQNLFLANDFSGKSYFRKILKDVLNRNNELKHILSFSQEKYLGAKGWRTILDVYTYSMIADVIHVVTNVSWFADISATVVAIGICFIWYHPLVFGTMWMKENNFTTEQLQNTGAKNGLFWRIPIIFILAANVAAFCKYFEFDTPDKTFLIGYDLGLVACLVMAVHYIHERRSIILYCINAGSVLFSLSAMGVVIGLTL